MGNLLVIRSFELLVTCFIGTCGCVQFSNPRRRRLTAPLRVFFSWSG
jgi:hypothetical protein